MCNRLMKTLVSLLTASTLVTVCSAGYYKVTYTYSGNLHAWNAYSSYNSSPYLDGSTVKGGIGISGNAHATGDVTITPHFEWIPDNPCDFPPIVAILREQASASGTTYPSGGTSSANDGIGHLVSNSNGSSVASGIRYTVIAYPGLNWSPPDPIHSVESANKNGGQVGAAMSYTSSLYPIWIDTDNTVNDYDIGFNPTIFAEASRPLNAYLTCHLPGALFDSYSWSATGPLVKDYTPSTSPTHPTPMSTSDWLVAAPTWYYYGVIDPTSITCQARIYTSDGLLNSNITINKLITVEKVEVGGTVAYSNETKQDLIGTLYSATNPSVTDLSGNLVGMCYSATPASCLTAPHFPPGGTLTNVQLVMLYWLKYGGIHLSTNNEYYLDNSFPYGTSPGYLKKIGSSTLVDLDDADSPSFGPIAYSVTSDFIATVLYKSYTAGSIYIPVSKINWTWNASGAMIGQPNGYGFFATNDFPEWDHVFTN